MNAAARSADPSTDIFQASELGACFARLADYPWIALAVSGGADSTALMLMIRAWLDLKPGGPHITVLTVDHRLRDAAASEAEWVTAQARALNFQHQTLVWEGEKPRTAIQAEARRARYDLMTAYCRAEAIPAIATAHTSDDQAETFAMRLARGSGLDGLSAMAEVSCRDGVDILRPLLTVSRRRIEAYLSRRGQTWLHDPSNDDERYERVRIRRKLYAARSLGLSPTALALSAKRLRRARDALERVTAEFLMAEASLHEAGFVTISLRELLGTDEEIALRALARMIAAVGGGSAPMRLSKIEAYCQMMRTAPRTATLGGCRVIAKGTSLTIVREIGRMERASESVIQPGETLFWDRRFRMTYADGNAGAATLRALGVDGVSAVKSMKGHFTGIPRLAAMTLPSLWIEGKLCYAPFVDFAAHPPEGWSTQGDAEFGNGGRMFAGGRKLHPHA